MKTRGAALPGELPAPHRLPHGRLQAACPFPTALFPHETIAGSQPVHLTSRISLLFSFRDASTLLPDRYRSHGAIFMHTTLRHRQRALVRSLFLALLLLAACNRAGTATPTPSPQPAIAQRWIATGPSAPVDTGNAAVVLTVRAPAETRVSEIELRLTPPDGQPRTLGPYAVQPGQTIRVEVDLTQLGSTGTAGEWRAEWVDRAQPDRVLAAVSFTTRPARAITWQSSAPRTSIIAGDCKTNRTIVELGIRARGADSNESFQVYAVIESPRGQTLSLPPIEVSGDQWSTLRASLCSVVPRAEQLPGTWTVRWYRSDQPTRPILSDSFGVLPAPTPTATPVPTLEWRVPTEPVQPYDCGAAVDIQVRNSAPGNQVTPVVVQAIPPGKGPVDLTKAELRGNEWVTVSLVYCQAAGGTEIAGTWTVRAVDSVTRQTEYGRATFDVRPIPAPTRPPAPKPQPPPQPAPPPPPPRQIDTDGDDLPDDEELSFGTDPYNSDTDSDGLSDGSEVYYYGTDPRKRDTDVDGFTDFEEILQGSDPWDPCSPWQFAYNCQQ